jgi:hypothetical protein
MNTFLYGVFVFPYGGLGGPPSMYVCMYVCNVCTEGSVCMYIVIAYFVG